MHPMKESIGLRMTAKGYVDGPLFRVRFHLSTGWITIIAWQGGFQAPNHTRIDCELRQGSRVIFPRGATWCATPGCVDDNAAKELAASLFAMKPGDTDAEYFESYTPEQLDWVRANGEELGMLASDRYCDEKGSVKP